MTRAMRKVYVALFSLLLVGLFAGSLRSLPGFEAPAGSSLVKGQWTKAFETYYDEEFPLKRLGTNVWAAIDYLAFGEGRPGVVVGREHWLFSDEEMHPIAEAEQNTAENWALIHGVRRELETQGIKLVLAILPAKVRLYPEYLGEEQPSRSLAPLYQQFHADANAAGLIAPDLLGPLQNAKQSGAQVFLRTDTHWTPSGAEVVARQLAERIRSAGLLDDAPRLFVTEPGPVQEHKGDLVSFLPLDPLFANLLPPTEQLQSRTTTQADEAADDAQGLFGEVSVPVAVVGTSYSANPKWNFVGALRQALQSDVVSYAEDGKGPILPMLAFLRGVSPEQPTAKVVIWEFPERYLPVANDLSGFDPKWLARLKDAPSREQRVAQRAINSQPVREAN